MTFPDFNLTQIENPLSRLIDLIFLAFKGFVFAFRFREFQKTRSIGLVR